MTHDNSTRFPVPSKPAKPHEKFPLFAHQNGQWAKKIRGRLHYFGKWADPDAAEAEYSRQKEDLHAGRSPRPDTEALTLQDLANAFIHAKRAAMESGELSVRTFDDYNAACELVLTTFGLSSLASGLRPDDFAALRKKMANKWGPHRVGTMIQCVRCLFKFGYENELLDRPIRYGPGFKRPSKKTLRLHRAKQGPKLFTVEEVRKMVDDAGTPMKAILLLGINCGFGNSDVGNLPLSALDLDRGWIDYPRPKTGIARRCPLWPETVEALREALAKRPKHKDAEDAGKVFLTQRGNSWAKDIADSPVTKETRKLLDRLGINGHRNYYTLRHTFRTVADESRDQPAVDHIMGHETPHMSSVYRETISDARLRAVADYVRTWLFGPTDRPRPEKP